MKKRIIVCFMLVALLCATGCGLPGCMNQPDQDRERVLQRMAEVTMAINARDKAALKAVFSKKAETDALEAGASIDKQIDEFFDLIRGEITESQYSSSVVYDSFGKERKKTIKSAFSVIFDEQSCAFNLLDCPINADSNEVGLYTLRVTRAEDWENQRSEREITIPGVYYKPGYVPEAIVE